MGDTFLDKGQIEDLVEYCGSTPTFWRQNDMLICCPVHGESNPSMGISVEKQVCHCFSCGFAGNFTKLLMCSLPDDFGYDDTTEIAEKRTYFKAYRKAEEFLADRYELEIKNVSRAKSVPRYGEVKKQRVKKKQELEILPMYKLAPFMSGKETYKYFFNRGFTKQNMVDFMIGRDLNSKTVTIPIFNKNDELVGVIGRYISKNRKHNERYKIYSFERGSILYPMNKFEPINDTAILVEGNFDAIRMFNARYINTLATMSNEMTEVQARIVSKLVDIVIYVGDNDKRGLSARDKNIELLKSYGVNVKIVTYPDHGKDPCDWSDKEIDTMIKSAKKKSLKVNRIE